ncbi:hypothetical protein BDQ17DRAFT_1435691 [Cyathus striatus]|nr:hypothetical protein BDQ17DRAFT_1435691 [Cyathus striatus]
MLHLQYLYNLPAIIAKCIICIPTVFILIFGFDPQEESKENDNFPNLDDRGGLKCLRILLSFQMIMKSNNAKPLLEAISSPGCRLEKIIISDPYPYFEMNNVLWSADDDNVGVFL